MGKFTILSKSELTRLSLKLLIKGGFTRGADLREERAKAEQPRAAEPVRKAMRRVFFPEDEYAPSDSGWFSSCPSRCSTFKVWYDLPFSKASDSLWVVPDMFYAILKF